MTATKEKILNSAEVLFAEQGFSETSMRLITSVAKVNLAAVNYHYGSKKDLIQAVIDRFFIEINDAVDHRFDQLSQQSEVSIQEILEALLNPILALDKRCPDTAANFMRLLGRAYTESQGHLKVFLAEKYGHLLTKFNALVHQANPELSKNDVFWRLHFMLGTLVFAFSGHQALRDIAEADLNENVDTEGLINYLIPFLTASMQTEPALEIC